MRVATALANNRKHTPKQKFICEKTKQMNKKDIQIFSARKRLNSIKKEIKVDRINITKPNGMISY
jgi:hypothetical protein